MAFKLPDFANTYCHVIGACGSVKSKSKKALEIVDGRRRRIYSRFAMGGKHAWLVVIIGGEDVEHHFHVDVVREELTKPDPEVDEECSIDDVQSFLRPVIGRTIEVVAHGVFIVPIKDLPKNSLIRPRFFRMPKDKDKVSINTVGMAFEIEGLVAPRLTWTRINKEKIRVELIAFLRGKIDEEYLVRFFQLLNTAFQAVVLGETRDEPRI